MTITGWKVEVGGEVIDTISPDDMDRLYDAIVEARACSRNLHVVCECGSEYRLRPHGFLASCTHQPVTKRIRSISHGI